MPATYPRGCSIRARSALALLLLFACTPSGPQPSKGEGSPEADAAAIVVLADPAEGPGADQVARGVELAVSEHTELLGKGLAVKRAAPKASALAAAAADENVLGVVTFGGRDEIAAARSAIETSDVPVFETRDDLYDASQLFGSVFQMSAPHPWEAYRLMRYFGPGDRGYKKVAVVHDASPDAILGVDALKQAAQVRGVEVVEAAGTPEQAVGGGVGLMPDAVVLEGRHAFLTEAVKLLSQDAYLYKGKESIRDASRPQVAGFSSMLGLEPPRGTVAAGDYALPTGCKGIIDRATRFAEGFRKRFNEDPVGVEMLGYDAAKSMIHAATTAGSMEHAKVIGELEKFDRVRFSHLPLSFSPTDHVGAERDMLGLWAVPDDPAKHRGTGRWRHLMRAFTSDLERTNIFDEDWAFFFAGATPGGEAPFFNTSRWGVITDRSDPFH